MIQNKFSVCKAAEGGDVVAPLTYNNAADDNSDRSFGEMQMCQHTSSNYCNFSLTSILFLIN